MKTIPLTKGYVAQVDDADYDTVVAAGPWRASVNRRPDGSIKAIYARRGAESQPLHRFLLGLPTGRIPLVDHADFDGLNCQRLNLRIANDEQNQHNRRTQYNSTSGLKGVYNKVAKKWQAQISVDGVRKNLGFFLDKTDAALAYDAAAVEHYGEFAMTNASLGLKKPVQSVTTAQQTATA